MTLDIDTDPFDDDLNAFACLLEQTRIASIAVKRGTSHGQVPRTAVRPPTICFCPKPSPRGHATEATFETHSAGVGLSDKQ